MKAFPQLAHWDIDERNGMDLRDYFAAKAMAALIQNVGGDYWLSNVIPKTAYSWADKMMEARK